MSAALPPEPRCHKCGHVEGSHLRTARCRECACELSWEDVNEMHRLYRQKEARRLGLEKP